MAAKNKGGSTKYPISFLTSFYKLCEQAAQMEGLSFPAYVKRLLYFDLLKKGLIKDQPPSA